MLCNVRKLRALQNLSYLLAMEIYSHTLGKVLHSHAHKRLCFERVKDISNFLLLDFVRLTLEVKLFEKCHEVFNFEKA